MSFSRTKIFQLDRPTILIYLFLVIFGYFNILSASKGMDFSTFYDVSKPYGKQLIFIGLSFVLIFFFMQMDVKFYERFASIIYLSSILSLFGLFILGKKVNGAISWYEIGRITIQPAEFAKFATSLALAKYVSDLQTNIEEFRDQLGAIVIITIPIILILMQNDAGSGIVFLALIFVLLREGIQQKYIYIGLSFLIIIISTLKFSVLNTCLIIAICLAIYQFFFKLKKKKFTNTLWILFVGISISLASEWCYNNILQKHQKDRISLWLKLEKDPIKLKSMKRSISYNLNESEKAISSGGFLGKGFNEGTRTKGKFVPAQHTDYIFSTIAEEWGFLGSSFIIILFVLLICRIIFLAEQNMSHFNRSFGYGVASILFVHFFINIGMVMGLIPTIGIPLPLISYGGSGLLGFTILIFVFLRLDSERFKVR